MAKETFYFSHDYSCINDPKIQALIGKHGAKGYGIFWRIVEMLHEDPDHRLSLKPYVFEAIASLFKEDVKTIKDIVNYMIDICELFQKDESFIFSQRVHKEFLIIGSTFSRFTSTYLYMTFNPFYVYVS